MQKSEKSNDGKYENFRCLKRSKALSNNEDTQADRQTDGPGYKGPSGGPIIWARLRDNRQQRLYLQLTALLAHIVDFPGWIAANFVHNHQSVRKQIRTGANIRNGHPFL